MGVLDVVLQTFTDVGVWFASAFENIIPMFYTAGESGAAGSLTFLGVLCIAGLAINVCFLLVSVISRFLNFRA